MKKRITKGKATATDRVIAALDQRMSAAVAGLSQSSAWQALDADADQSVARAMLRELYGSVYSYHRHVFQAASAIIGRPPLSGPQLFKSLCAHLAEEAGHGEMALRAHVALGGVESTTRMQRLRPATFAIASFWWGLERLERPECYLGAMYLFEASTPILYRRVLPLLRRFKLAPPGMEHANTHMKVDARHVALLRRCIEIVVDHRGAEDAICFGMEAFTAVYPKPLFEEAYATATAKPSA